MRVVGIAARGGIVSGVNGTFVIRGFAAGQNEEQHERSRRRGAADHTTRVSLRQPDAGHVRSRVNSYPRFATR